MESALTRSLQRVPERLGDGHGQVAGMGACAAAAVLQPHVQPQPRPCFPPLPFSKPENNNPTSPIFKLMQHHLYLLLPCCCISSSPGRHLNSVFMASLGLRVAT